MEQAASILDITDLRDETFAVASLFGTLIGLLLKKLLMAESLMKSEPTLLFHMERNGSVRTNFICRFNLAQLYLLRALIKNYILVWQLNIDGEFVESV